MNEPKKLIFAYNSDWKEYFPHPFGWMKLERTRDKFGWYPHQPNHFHAV
jgi:hypothetical protein